VFSSEKEDVAPESIVAVFVVELFNGVFSSEEVAPECIGAMFMVESFNGLFSVEMPHWWSVWRRSRREPERLEGGERNGNE